MFHNLIENSRKRHLSPSTFRGDQAVDRLLVQELSASPLLKKTKALPTIGSSVDNMALSSKDFFEYMDRNVTRQLAEVSANVATNSKKIEEQSGLVRRNADSIAALQNEIQDIRKNRATYVAAVGMPTSPTALSTEDDSMFDRARRSARLWPVLGRASEEMWRNTGQFLADKLGLYQIQEGQIEAVSRPQIPSRPSAKDEVLVVFREVETRDTVFGASSKLAAYVDGDNRPTAGISNCVSGMEKEQESTSSSMMPTAPSS